MKSSDGEEFKAHRLVLAKRSDVFDAMLRTDMKEKESNVIELSEDAITSKLLLQLMYDQEIKGNYKNFIDLAEAAGKYLMTKDQSECVKKLADLLDPISAVEIWLYASRNNFDELEAKSFDYVTKYVSKKNPQVSIQYESKYLSFKLSNSDSCLYSYLTAYLIILNNLNWPLTKINSLFLQELQGNSKFRKLGLVVGKSGLS